MLPSWNDMVGGGSSMHIFVKIKVIQFFQSTSKSGVNTFDLNAGNRWKKKQLFLFVLELMVNMYKRRGETR